MDKLSDVSSEPNVAMPPLVTTYLEMHSPKEFSPKRTADQCFQVREEKPNWVFNRDMYLAVGENWTWIDRRGWTDQQWKYYAGVPALRTFGAYYDGIIAGYYELLGQPDPNEHEDGVEIAYFGLLPQFIGRGLGGALLTSAIEHAWHTSPVPSRVWVHTCNRDHPGALANYQARGMKIYKIVTAKSPEAKD